MGVRPFFDIKPGGIGLSRNPGDQTKRSSIIRKRVNTLPFPPSSLKTTMPTK